MIRKLRYTDARRLPLVEVPCIGEGGAGLAFEGLQSEVDPVPKAFVNSDIFVNAVETPHGLTLDCDYNTDLFDEETITRWLGYYETILRAIAARASETVFSLPIWTDAERRRVLVEWNDTARDFPREATVEELFEAQAGRTPRAIAGDGDERAPTATGAARQPDRPIRPASAPGGILVGGCASARLAARRPLEL